MRALIVGDTHLPAVHPGYLSFCKDLAQKYRCNKFIHIGDLVDWHAVSQHDKQPEAKDALSEFEEARSHIKKWERAFPEMIVLEGNHDARIARQAATVNIPQRFLKGYNELWDTKWEWKLDHKLDNVYFHHGTGTSGQFPAVTTMQKMLMSVCQGHIHSAGGIWWRANPERRIFGMNTGCGVDDKHIAFTYGEHLKVRSILSAGVVLDGTPAHIIMPASRGEKYHRSRF